MFEVTCLEFTARLWGDDDGTVYHRDNSFKAGRNSGLQTLLGDIWESCCCVCEESSMYKCVHTVNNEHAKKCYKTQRSTRKIGNRGLRVPSYRELCRGKQGGREFFVPFYGAAVGSRRNRRQRGDAETSSCVQVARKCRDVIPRLGGSKCNKRSLGDRRALDSACCGRRKSFAE
ncbi:hypothetical protein IscW_ISCW023073 [Ixodes scapularis]|uniref:Uncharacterized protein n=1 Tax=Ixodes scapularis TaxID=6945 RepID=B7QLY5_IXOSC|nr:hypothetical protein IscW_ISCW023073 [Ixodes scapularis]|eukprot:XP_002416190.1 hypothetical protein IscW_ISCW023073 [Ixodes scapularis]